MIGASEELQSSMIRIGDIVYIELGSAIDHFIQCDGFMNDKIIVEDYSRPEKKMNFSKCLFLVLPGDHHGHKSQVHKLITKVIYTFYYRKESMTLYYLEMITIPFISYTYYYNRQRARRYLPSSRRPRSGR